MFSQMTMTLFDTVKSNITTRQAAEQYGLEVNRQGMCKCPFHDDKNPSMKVDSRYHCFGCQADGDVISFTSRLFNVSPKDAAIKLANDFGIQYNPNMTTYSPRKPYQVSDEDVFAHKASFVYHELVNYRNLLVQWMQQFAPKTPDEEPHPRFMEAINNLAFVEYQLDVLLYDSDAAKKEIVTDYLEEKMNHKEVPAVEPIVTTPIYKQSATHARKYGELEQFKASHWANIDCKRDIEKAIKEHFDGMRLDRKAIDGVMERYGADRVSLVLAATVQVKAWDGRFSSANKDWAFTFDFPNATNDLGFDRRDNYAVTSHPAVLDGFINLVRQAIKAREHPVEKTEEMMAAVPAPKPKHKASDMER